MGVLSVRRPQTTGHTSWRTDIFILDRKALREVNVEIPSQTTLILSSGGKKLLEGKESIKRTVVTALP